jgi:c-opsin
MTLIVISYGNILRVIRKLKSEIINNKKMMLNFRKISQQKETSRQSDAAEKRSTFMVAVMIGAFLVAWTPYSILALIETFGNRNDDNVIPPVLATVPNLFAKTSAVFNPIIYGFLNTQVYNRCHHLLNVINTIHQVSIPQFKLTWEKFSLRFVDRSGDGQSYPMQFLDSSAAGQLTRGRQEVHCSSAVQQQAHTDQENNLV